ncbi:hypothetical protein GQ457_16G009130 [Hibiscus cannabinus]
MASIPKLYTNYSFSNEFSQFPNPQTVPQENYTAVGGAIIPGATWGEEISFIEFGRPWKTSILRWADIRRGERQNSYILEEEKSKEL